MHVSELVTRRGDDALDRVEGGGGRVAAVHRGAPCDEPPLQASKKVNVERGREDGETHIFHGTKVEVRYD